MEPRSVCTENVTFGLQKRYDGDKFWYVWVTEKCNAIFCLRTQVQSGPDEVIHQRASYCSPDLVRV
uniref:Uncharacterized protein n=1 Tax=Romanomermis culicivorax TaxID=13658 RepID=A0A915L4V0_ROMCU